MMHLTAALRLLLERPLASLFGAIALALGLVLAGLAVWVLTVVGSAEAAVEEQVVLRARLDPKLDKAATETALLALSALGGVREVAWVGPEAQRNELVQILGDELLAGLDDAVFPKGGLARITLERGVISSGAALDALLATVSKVESVKGVERVPFDPRHLAFLFDAAGVARVVGLGLALLALLAGALAVYQRTALALATRTHELALYRSFGASESWLMGRYFVLALVVGAAAAGIAILVGLLIDGPLADLASLLPGNQGQGVTSLFYLVGALGGGLGLAAVAGLYAVRGERARLG